MTAPHAGSSRWLHGPTTDLLFGCGGAYALYFLAASFAGPSVRGLAPEGLLPIGALILGAPHYGATLLRAYTRAEDRRAYRLFGTWASLAVVIFFVAGVYDVRVGSLMITIYMSWSPWHYSSQNYGVASMFLRRRGVPVTRLGKRLLHASFQLSWLLVLLAIHAAQPSAGYAPVELTSSAYHFLPLKIPLNFAGPLVWATAIAYLAVVAATIVELRRSAPWRDLAPTMALMGTQALWFSLPVLARLTALGVGLEPLGVRYAVYTFYWIAFGHFTQYLWVTLYYARSSGSDRRKLPYFIKSLLLGSAIWGIPLALFSPETFGVLAFDAGLGTLIASAVNIHHFVLDGVIWKLRDRRVARILLHSPGVQGAPVPRERSPARVWLLPLIFAAGIGNAVADIVWIWEMEYGFRRAALAADDERLRTAARRLRWLGRAHPGLHAQIAIFDSRAGHLDDAIREIERSLELHATAEAWVLLGNFRARKGLRSAARSAYREALAIDPGSQTATRALKRLRAADTGP